MRRHGKYNKQMLEELRRRRPELSYDLDVISEALDPIDWVPITEKGKRRLREYFKERKDAFINEDIEEVIQSNIRYNDPEYIHELPDHELITRMVYRQETPQGGAYMKWLFFKYFQNLVWEYPDHDLDLTLDEARSKYRDMDELPWLDSFNRN